MTGMLFRKTEQKTKMDLYYEKLNPIVIALVGEKLSGTWWNSENYAFNMRTPYEMLMSDPDRVKKYLLDYCQR
jgi:hypothetical protein